VKSYILRMGAPTQFPDDLGFIILLFVLFVIPKALQRYRIPAAITSLVLGAVAANAGWVSENPTISLLSTFGIVSLFLFAGLEIDGGELQRGSRLLIQHAVLWAALTVAIAIAATRFGLSVRAAALVALAISTPSTGFILASLPALGLDRSEQFAVKSKAVGSELLSLAALFFVVQSETIETFSISVAALLGVIVVIPFAFRAFAAFVAPVAPKSEFAFLLMVAVICAYATRRLGVYYLVGAFIVGIAAQRFRARLPAMSSERMIDALEAFGSVFIPFYFFRSGMKIDRAELTWPAIGLGALLLLIFVPLRAGLTMLHRRWVLSEATDRSRRVGIALLPTLVFTLVLSDILRTRFGAADTLLGALVIYTVINTMIPAFALGAAPPSFEEVQSDPPTAPVSEERRDTALGEATRSAAPGVQ
jgi:Kef-type K+ transport system membrane component KefB